jgi:hypothetical protein
VARRTTGGRKKDMGRPTTLEIGSNVPLLNVVEHVDAGVVMFAVFR